MCGSQGGCIATKSGMVCRGSDEGWGIDMGRVKKKQPVASCFPLMQSYQYYTDTVSDMGTLQYWESCDFLPHGVQDESNGRGYRYFIRKLGK